MKKIRVQDAVGKTLCHDMTAILENGFKGVIFRRGHEVVEEDISVMLDIGKAHIFVWDAEIDEIHEDDAAHELVKAMCGDNLVYTGPNEGKFQISSKIDGMFWVDSNGLRLINSVEHYTVATRNGYSAVSAGEKLAGARIIPLVTKQVNVDLAVKIARDNYPILNVVPYRVKKVAAIITGSEIFNGRIKDAFQPILQRKVGLFSAELIRTTICDDDLDAIKSTIADYVSSGIELILLTGGMSVDPDDLTPTAIRESGAKVVSQGAPMQPGNMLTIAYLGSTVLVGVPGASMHSPVTSLDVFLPRIMAGISINKKDIIALGEGGFCAACAQCRYPMCYFGKT